MKVDEKMIKEVVANCNGTVISDSLYHHKKYKGHPIEWFKKYFDFIDNESVQLHLEDAYYQARFLYKLMSALRLTYFKQSAITKFQINNMRLYMKQ